MNVLVSKNERLKKVAKQVAQKKLNEVVSRE
jgi:hypothetical protein